MYLLGEDWNAETSGLSDKISISEQSGWIYRRRISSFLSQVLRKIAALMTDAEDLMAKEEARYEK